MEIEKITQKKFIDYCNIYNNGFFTKNEIDYINSYKRPNSFIDFLEDSCILTVRDSNFNLKKFSIYKLEDDWFLICQSHGRYFKIDGFENVKKFLKENIK